MIIKKYNVSNKILKNLIKYYWVIDSENQLVDHKLLPVCNFDLIFNFSSPIKYTLENELTHCGFHLNGIKTKYSWIKQSGNINVIGISFMPIGIYPFLKIPSYELVNKTIDLSSLNEIFTSELNEKLHSANSVLNKIEIIEIFLVNLLDDEYFSSCKLFNMFEAFFSNIENLNINQFCDMYGVHAKKLERIFKKYIGISPKLYSKIGRFQKSLKQIIIKDYDKLTNVAYENNYYDQMHFIKDFKEFTGCSPQQFITQKKSVKENIVII